MTEKQFWVSNIQDLDLLKFWPCKDASAASNANSFTVLTMYISIVASIIVKTYTPLYLGILVIAGIAVFYYLYYDPEQFSNYLNNPVNNYIPPEVSSNNLRPPTPNNPFMNIPIEDYDRPQQYDNYNRYKEATYPTPETENIRKEVNKEFVAGLFQDPNGRLFERQNSQRQYISQPVGEVPNRQNEFAQWLYGKEFVAKTGSIYMRYGLNSTPDSLMNTGNNSSQPSNWGIKEKYV